MEELNVVVNQWDAKRLLSREDYETLELFAESIRRGRTLVPWAESRYDHLLEKVKKMMLREHAEMLAEEYTEKLKEDDFSLEELSDGWAVSSRQEAIEFLTKAFPDLRRSSMNLIQPTGFPDAYLKSETWSSPALKASSRA